VSHPITSVVHFSHLSFLAGSVTYARVLHDETIVVQGVPQRHRAGFYSRAATGEDAWRRQRCGGSEFPDMNDPFHEGALIAHHPCPFLSDVHDDRATTCTCCKACQGSCCDEI